MGGCLPCGRFVRFCPPHSLIAQQCPSGSILFLPFASGAQSNIVLGSCDPLEICATAINDCNNPQQVEFRIYIPVSNTQFADVDVVEANGFTQTNVSFVIPGFSNSPTYHQFVKTVTVTGDPFGNSPRTECMFVDYRRIGTDNQRKAFVDVTVPGAPTNVAALTQTNSDFTVNFTWKRPSVLVDLTNTGAPSVPIKLSEVDFTLNDGLPGPQFLLLPEPGTEYNFPSTSMPPPDNSIYRVHIVEDFIVDQDYTFAPHWEVRIDPGVTITVQDGAKLTLDNATIKSCEGLWESIIVRQNSDLEIINSSHVEGGERAVVARANSTISINNSTFLNNNRAITSDNQGSGTVQLNLGVFNTEISAPNVGLPLEDYLGYAGFDLKFHNAVTIDQTHIHDVEYGARIRSADIIATDCFFEDIDHTAIYNYGGIATVSASNFSNVPGGITSIYGSNYVFNNAMDKVKRGINITFSDIRIQDIQDNTFDVSQYAVQSRFSSGYGEDPRFVNNDVYINGNEVTSFGVGIRDLNDGGGWTISDNFIEMGKAKSGIQIIGGSEYRLQNNVTMMENDQLAFGLLAQGSDNVEASCNFYSSSNATANSLTPQKTGFYAEMIYNSNLLCNSFDNLRHGMQITDMNDKTQLKGNSFANYYYGLVYGTVPFGYVETPLQTLNGNDWSPNSISQNDAINFETDFNRIQNSRFRVNTIPNVLTPHVPNAQWFVTDNGNEYQCEDSELSCPNFNEPPGGEGEGLDEEIATKNTEEENAQTRGSLWSGKMHVRERVAKNGTESMVVQNFATQESSEETYRDYESQLYAALRPDPSMLAEYTNHTQQIREKMTELADLNAQIAAGTTGLEGARQYVIDQLYQHRVATNDLETTMQLEITGELGSMEAVATGSAIYEQNYAAVLNIVRESSLEPAEELSAAHTNMLRNIALQCPTTGGEAVYKARALLGSDYDLTIDQACGEVEGRAGVQEEFAVREFALSPNPANEAVLLTMEQRKSGTILLTDSYGKLLESFRITDEQSRSITTKNFAPGVYFISVRTDDGNVLTERLIILH